MLPVDDVCRVVSIALSTTRSRGSHRRDLRLKIETAGRHAISTERQNLPGLHVAVSPLRHGYEIGSPRYGVPAELLGAVGIGGADDEAAVLVWAAPVEDVIPLCLDIDLCVDHRFSTLLVPRPEVGVAFALAAVDGEDGIREAWPVNRDAASLESLGVVCVDPCAVWGCAIFVNFSSAGIAVEAWHGAVLLVPLRVLVSMLVMTSPPARTRLPRLAAKLTLTPL